MNAVLFPDAADLHRVIASRLEDVDVLCRDLRLLCQKRGWLAASFGLELVLRECLNNAILHGNRGDPSKRIEVRIADRSPWVRVQVTDQGTGFNWRATRGRSLPEGDETHGRGLPIMTRYARRVRFNPQGNQITLWFEQVPKTDSSDL